MSPAIAPRFGTYAVYTNVNGQDGPLVAQNLAEKMRRDIPSLPVYAGTTSVKGENCGFVATGEHAAILKTEDSLQKDMGVSGFYGHFIG